MSDAAAWTSPSMRSLRRIAAMVVRYSLLLKNSWTRIFELAYWPTIQMVLWGFISVFFRQNSSWVAQAGGVLIAGVLLWDVMFRGQLGVSVSFMEEMWSRNLGHLFTSPLRPIELAVALMTMSLIRTLIGIVPAALLAIPLYQYSIFTMGLPLIAFFVNLLVMGWALGLMLSGLILRFGQSAESLAWLAVFLLAPVSAIYYPLSILPPWLQAVGWALPSAHVFEGMRAVLFEQSFRLDHLAWAAGLNLVYMAFGVAAFLFAVRVARRRGLLLQMGE
ncbi:MAG: ABC transporter permease [Alphaproteobacteria bacterium]|nr:ABC transporter permease [Alphaproteobacteria bacterium]